MSKKSNVEEYEAILQMLQEAEANGLEVEVINSFGDMRAEGLNVKDAAWGALLDWDIA